MKINATVKHKMKIHLRIIITAKYLKNDIFSLYRTRFINMCSKSVCHIHIHKLVPREHFNI